MTPDEFATNVADYMATRITPWRDEEEMREAVRTAVRLVFGEARHDAVRCLVAVDALTVCDTDCTEHYDGKHYSTQYRWVPTSAERSTDG